MGRTTVLTNGCFDILHAGHVAYLREARLLGDELIVGLNSDASVRALKGPGRPVNPAGDRAAVLSALSSVDDVVVFDELDPRRLIEEIRPAVYVKGGDYDEATLPERDLVHDLGGTVRVLSLLPGRSTSAILSRLTRSEGGDNADLGDQRALP